jgi:glycosyltransferase involved in cell wall biosynthesis
MRTSIAMCTFNGAQYIQRQLESLAAQDHCPDELVVVDDGSTDETLALIERFASYASFPIHIHRNVENLGPTANFQKALSLATGDVIFTSDQDDVWAPQKITRMLPHFEDPKAVVVACNAALVDGDLKSLGTDLWTSVGFDEQQRARARGDEAFDVLVERNFVAGMAMAVRRSFLQVATPFPKVWMFDGWIALIAAAQSGVRFEDATLVRYRLHGRNHVGVRQLTWRDKLKFAWELPRAELLLRAEQMDALLVRLSTELSRERVRALAGRAAHYRARCHLSPRRRHRAGSIVTELLEGRYHAYSHGLSAAIRDLIR